MGLFVTNRAVGGGRKGIMKKRVKKWGKTCCEQDIGLILPLFVMSNIDNPRNKYAEPG